MKYILMFFTFLSVCTTTDLLTIPLTLDKVQTVTIPAGATTLDETYTVNAADDADFQKYLSTIKSYQVDGISISSDSYTGNASTTFNGEVTISGVTIPLNNWNLGVTAPITIPYSTAELTAIASALQANNSTTFKLKGTLNNSTGGTVTIHIKINMKIKVV